MSHIKRALYSIRHRWPKIVLLFLVFSVLFTAMLSVYIIYQDSARQTDYARTMVGGALVLEPTKYRILSRDAYTFIDSSYVEAYGLQGIGYVMRGKDCEPVIAQAHYDWFDQFPQYPDTAEAYIGPNGTFRIFDTIPVSNSEYHNFFVNKGFSLIDGEPIAPADDMKNVAVVSQEFAELNELSIGDSFTLYFPNNYANYYKRLKSGITTTECELPLTVQGIFTYPSETGGTRNENARNLDFYNSSRSNVVFIPCGVASDIYGRILNRDYFDSRDEFASVTVYLKDPSMVDAFVQEMQEKLPIVGVYDRNEALSLDSSDTSQNITKEEYETGVYRYIITLNREWYETIALPMEKTSSLTGAMTIGILGGILIVLVLITALSFKGRRREIGILLSMGKREGRIFGQLLVETTLPIVLALFVGLFAAQPVADALVSPLMEENVEAALKLGDSMGTRAANQLGGPIITVVQDSGAGNSAALHVRADVDTTLTLSTAALYILVVVLITLLTVFTQTMLVLRKSPARILLEKGR